MGSFRSLFTLLFYGSDSYLYLFSGQILICLFYHNSGYICVFKEKNTETKIQVKAAGFVVIFQLLFLLILYFCPTLDCFRLMVRNLIILSPMLLATTNRSGTSLVTEPILWSPVIWRTCAAKASYLEESKQCYPGQRLLDATSHPLALTPTAYRAQMLTSAGLPAENLDKMAEAEAWVDQGKHRRGYWTKWYDWSQSCPSGWRGKYSCSTNDSFSGTFERFLWWGENHQWVSHTDSTMGLSSIILETDSNEAIKTILAPCTGESEYALIIRHIKGTIQTLPNWKLWHVYREAN